MTEQWINRLLWIIYIALLGVLLPHTAWTFSQFEPQGQALVGWIAALAFEGAIAAFTWRLKQHIEASPRHKATWKRFHVRYLNTYSAGLTVAIAISAAANFAHAVEFARPFILFTQYRISPALYSVGFGAILPLCSLLFARVLADVRSTEAEEDTALTEEKTKRREAERARRQAEADLQQLSARLAEAEGMVRWMFAEEKRQRIAAIHEQWPALPNSAIAVLAEASTSYVSEVLKPPTEE